MMDPNLIAIAARSVERIVAVLFGGLAVYYGFRLFLVVPIETSGDGKIQLPGISVVLVKAGPGLFFAAFGALVIITSLTSQVKVGVNSVYQGVADAVSPTAGQGGAGLQTERRAAEQEVARVRVALQTLNCMQRLSAAGPKTLPVNDSELAVREAKLALLGRVWVGSEWGDFETFKQWASGGTASTASSAKMLFDAERADCPR